MAFKIELTQPFYKDTKFGREGWFIEGMIVTASNGKGINVPLSGFYLGDCDKDGKWCDYTQEMKDAAPAEERARMIVRGDNEAAQLEEAINWLADIYEERLAETKPKEPAKETIELPNFPVAEGGE